MYSSLQLAGKYLHYYLTASNGKGHGMHSPFVFDFILNVVNDQSHYRPPAEIEKLRRQLYKDERKLIIDELGAGSRTTSSDQRTVASIARTAVKSPRYSQLLFRLAKHYQPATIVELGTSLGITTAYLSKANEKATVYTIEGSEQVAGVAMENLKTLGCDNVQVITGNFDVIVPEILLHATSPMLAYIDGNHRYEPTMNYFFRFLEISDEYSILVFDDIHWSSGMEKAWEEIKAHPAVMYTVDIFFLGFDFFRKDFKVKQDFIIRF